MTYQERLKTHFAKYKREELGIAEPGVFRYRGREVLHDHILPEALASKNLLEEADAEATAFFKAHPKKRHKDFHHLNSSQAFAFNLFFPYFTGGDASASTLLRALGQDGQLLRWEPEAVPNAAEQTNIDVLWTTTDGVKTFCEVKLSEAEFGTAKDDAHHRGKLLEKYGPVLSGHLQPERLGAKEFFKAYQFNRNVWHMVSTPRSRLIFLLPRANTRLWTQLEHFLAGVAPSTQQRISPVAIEDVIQRLSADTLCSERMRKYARKLAQKYLVQSALRIAN